MLRPAAAARWLRLPVGRRGEGKAGLKFPDVVDWGTHRPLPAKAARRPQLPGCELRESFVTPLALSASHE
eukprot:155972-Chlamydomonas_euryale.AAC.1